MQHSQLAGFIWNIANKLRGPYRPPQYRRVMLPLVVLRRFDCVLAKNKAKVLAQKEVLEAKGISGQALEKALAQAAGNRNLYNISGFTFANLLADPENLTANLTAYIQGFSPQARNIFEKFEFENEIAKLDEHNRLFLILQEFANVDLSPERISNLQMGYLFEELVRKFNEQANEEAGDHFTPREVIRLMVELLFTDEQDVFTAGIYRSIYDPTAGTGGMLSEAEKYIKEQNPNAYLELFGQEYNAESYAICCADLLIKDEEIGNLVYGDTLGTDNSKNKGNDFTPHDGHMGKQFHYMLANPPYGVDWDAEKNYVTNEYKNQGFDGRFGAGLPRINDGSLLFLQHMIAKMKDSPAQNGEGSKIAIVFNGSPLFTGDAGSGESNIRRWIIENDWLDAVVALPDQMFYNTGIYTYIWIVSNKKPPHRQGKVQLIDGTRHFQKMSKSLGNKRNELSEAHIADLVKHYGEYRHDGQSELTENRTISKIFRNQDFGFLKITVERPLRQNFQASPERIARLSGQTAFANLAKSKKIKDEQAAQTEMEAGRKQQQAIVAVLEKLDGDTVYKSRNAFEKVLDKAFKAADIKLPAPLKKAVFAALAEKDPTADIVLDGKGNAEPDSDLRDSETVSLPENISLPLPLGYDGETGHSELLDLVKAHCEDYLQREVLPHVPDAWIDHSKTKVGYEIPLTRHFYRYTPPRPLDEIAGEIRALEQEIATMLKTVV